MTGKILIAFTVTTAAVFAYICLSLALTHERASDPETIIVEVADADYAFKRFSVKPGETLETGNPFVDREINGFILLLSQQSPPRGEGLPRFFVSEWRSGMEIFIIRPDGGYERLEYTGEE